MPILIDEAKFDQRLSALERSKAWSPRLVSRLENLVRTGDDSQLFRVNPKAYALAKSQDENETIDLFLHATAHNLFAMDWLLVCPGCSAAVESFRNLRSVGHQFYCNFCRCHFETSLDDYIVVAFTVASDIRDIIFHHPETLAVADYCFGYKWLNLGLRKDGRSLPETIRSLTSALEFIPPHASVPLTVHVQSGHTVRGWTVEGNAYFSLTVSGDPVHGGQEMRVECTSDSCTLPTLQVVPGPLTLIMDNQSAERFPFGLALIPDGQGKTPLTFSPFLSGKQLVTSQTFRDLFRAEVIGASEGIGVKDITLLFTDLKGSTALYDRIGDLTAFALVQGHFERLRDVTAHNRGAVIKTIGDAVMAAFAHPADAVRAALEMLSEIDHYNHGASHRDLVLKIGIHKGAAIAVTLNDRLDYFGQTVNIAARVQGLAEQAEIYLTKDVFESEGVAALVGDLKVSHHIAQLKGVGQDMPVCRVSPG